MKNIILISVIFISFTGCISSGHHRCTINTAPPIIVLTESRRYGCRNWIVANIQKIEGINEECREKCIDDITDLRFFTIDSLIAVVDSIMISDTVSGYNDKVILLHIVNRRIGGTSIIVTGKEAGHSCRPSYIVTDSMVNLSIEEQKCLDADASKEP